MENENLARIRALEVLLLAFVRELPPTRRERIAKSFGIQGELFEVNALFEKIPDDEIEVVKLQLERLGTLISNMR